MNDGQFELIRGSGNVFRDMGDADSEVLQLKAILAGEIIAVLDARKISVHQACELTGFAAADFSRVRKAKVRHLPAERAHVDVGQARSLTKPPASSPHEHSRRLTKEHNMNYVLSMFGTGRAKMIRAVLEEAAALASITLFVGMIVVWAQVLSAL